MPSSPLFETFARAPLAFERGQGTWLFTADGERYLDFAAGIAVNSLGHAHPRLVAALTRQAETLWHVSNLYEVPGQRKAAERLVAASFADRVFFTNSGAEALECAIKTARRFQYAAGRPERYRLITFEGAFHGRTLATIAAGGQKKYLEGFGPAVDGFDQAPLGDIEAVRRLIGPETAGILIEPIQGEGGIREASVPFLKELRTLCDDHGMLLIFDEVQTGAGRTGRLFAHEWAGVTPDLMAIAKGIGGGFPVGACLGTEAAAACMTPGIHGTTYGGNPLAMAVVDEVLRIMLEPGFMADVEHKGLLFRQGLSAVIDAFPGVFEEVRGKGLLIGLKCKVENTRVNAAFRHEKLLAVPAGDNVVRIIPPLTVSDDEIRDGLARIHAAGHRLASGAA
ncbi:MAG: aspartate aminotransferase family protein [Rhizobiaceae bacterium]